MNVDMGTVMCQEPVQLLVYLYSVSIIVSGQVLRLPGKPYNLSCISYNYLDLTCSGILPKPTTNLSMKWIMQFRKAGLCMVEDWNDWKNIPWSIIPENLCRLVDDVHVYCSWYSVYRPPDNMTFSRLECHQIRIGVKTKAYGTNWSKPLTFMPARKVKPDPVRLLDSEYNHTHGSTFMKLTWLPPDIPPTIRLKYKLQINSEENWDVKTLIYKTRSKGNVTYNLTHLLPYVNYTVTVYAQPVVAKDELYWSQGSSITFKTPDDVPGMPPILTMGSFTTSNCSDVNMCLVLYWKNPPRRYYGGICSYKVRVDPDLIEVTNISYRVYYKLDQQLTKAVNHTVNLWLMTRKGSSAQSAKLVVPNWQTAMIRKPKWVTVELDEHGASVSWSIDMNICARITSVTYYWCIADSKDFTNTQFFGCQDNLDWYTINGTNACRQSSNPWMSRTGDQSSIRYGVSVTVDDVSGGMMWERYRFKKANAVPVKPLYGVASSSPGQLRVTILFDDYYVSAGGCPSSYQITYDTFSTSTPELLQCPRDGKTKSFLANLTNPEMILDDLVPDTKYVVCVVSTNKAGQGQMGDPKVGITFGTKGSVQNASIIGIAVPTIILFMVILIAIVCFLKSALRDRISKIDNIQVPFASDTEYQMVTFNLMEADMPNLEGFQKKNLNAHSYIKSSPSSNTESQPADQQDKTTYNPEMVLSRSDKSCISNAFILFETVQHTSGEENIMSDNSHNVSDTIIVPSEGNNSERDNSRVVPGLGRVTSKSENCCLDNSRDTLYPENVTNKTKPRECKKSYDFRVNGRDNEKCKDSDYLSTCQVSTEQHSSSNISEVQDTGEINNTNNGENMSNESKLEGKTIGEIMSDYVTAIGKC